MGQRYGLGAGAGFFGIWDLQAPGAPVHRFPRTEEGWRDAWETFFKLEPAARPVGAGAAWGSASQGRTGLDPMGTVAQGTNGPAIASLVLGILGAVLWFPIIGLVLGISAIVFAYLGFKRAERTGVGRGLAIAGLVLGIIATLAGVMLVAVFSEVVDQVNRIRELQEP
jgi:hypothetical protein